MELHSKCAASFRAPVTLCRPEKIPYVSRVGGGLARQRLRFRVAAFKDSESSKKLEELRTRVAIVGSGPAAHTAAIYAARAELQPVLFEGFMANGIAPGGQLTTTTYVENFPGFVEPILGADLTENFRKQSVRYGTRVFTETVNTIDLGGAAPAPASTAMTAAAAAAAPSARVGSGSAEAAASGKTFTLWTDTKRIVADTVIIATGASARKLVFPGSGDASEGGFWNRGISACAVCDGTSPLVRGKVVGVVGGGDAAMEEAMFLTRYASKVYIIHRFDHLEASKVMAKRALANPKIEVLWRSQVVQADGNDEGNLGSVVLVHNAPTNHHVQPPPLTAIELAGTTCCDAVVSSGDEATTAGCPEDGSTVPRSARLRRGASSGSGSSDGSDSMCYSRLPLSALFFAIGHKPATEFLKGQLALDPMGYIVTVPGSTVTSIPGVFAAGDVQDHKYRQAITAAGSGCMAALEVERYLQAMDAGLAPDAAAGQAVTAQHNWQQMPAGV